MGAFNRFIGRSFFKLIRWELKENNPDVPKYVCVLAPHTSIWDMIWGKMYNWATDMKPIIMVKKEFFFFPMGPLLKLWGSFPIDRNYPGGVVQQMADEFKKRDTMILAITPEGTRKANPDWKTGFYRIAEAADVPIYVSYSDFKSKKAGFFGEFKRTGNMEEDIKAIKEMYRGMEGLYRGKFAI
jgi:1-acyl-sn-glycerol-3-phosphate acyltransferase